MKHYTATRLPRHQGPAAWAEILGPGAPFERLEDEITADLVIIGGGFAGLSAARRALQIDPNLWVVVLEAGLLAEGAAGRNSGFMIDLPHDLASDDYAGQGADGDRKLIALNRQAQAFGQAAVEDYGIDPAHFDPAGKVNGAATEAGEAHNASYGRHLAGLGEASQHLDAQAMRDLTGSRHYRSGLYTPGTVMLQPAGYIRGLGAGLKRQAKVYERSPSFGFRRVSGCWQVLTPKGRVTAPRVILATNGHLESFGIEQGRLMQIFLFASMTMNLCRAPTQGQPRWGITPADPMGTTMRRITMAGDDTRIITRTCAAMRPGMRATDKDVARAAAVHRAKFDTRFPLLKNAAMQYTWAGHLCLSRNGVSVMREVDRDVFSACVQNGLGTARGTLTGIGAAEMALGVDSDITRHFGTEARPKHLPPPPFARLGANAYLRWKEWRAGAE